MDDDSDLCPYPFRVAKQIFFEENLLKTGLVYDDLPPRAFSSE